MDVIKLENIITKTTLIDMTIVGSSFIVTANAEHIPKTCIEMGLLSSKGSTNIFLLLLDMRDSDCLIFTTSFS